MHVDLFAPFLRWKISGQAGGFLYWDNIATPACPRLSVAQGASPVPRASPAKDPKPRASR
jgi:hypothetical protein